MEHLIFKKEIIDVFEDAPPIKTAEYQFILKYYQQLGSILVNQYTNHKRLLCVTEPGMGKTLFSLNIAHNMSKVYYDHWLIDGNVNGHIVVLGTTNDIFQDELLSWLNFGFVNKDEVMQLHTLRQKASNISNTEAQDEYLSYRNHLKRRLKNKQYRGFYHFFGYKKFVNDLFILPKNFDMLIYTIDQVIELIKKGTILLNKNVTNLFENKNSVIIADEFHDTYNSVEKNTYGYAIKVILYYYPETRLIALTATEINNSSTELLDILSFLEYHDQVPEDLFKDGVLTRDPSKLESLFNFLVGKIVVFRNTNTRDYPSTIQHGEYIDVMINGKRVHEDILKFVKCSTSEFNDIKKKFVSDAELQSESILYDIFIPKVAIVNGSISVIGHFSNIKQAYAYYREVDIASIEANFIRITQQDEIYRFEGSFLQKDNLKLYSPKYYTMLTTILDNIARGRGKTYIYHKYINEGINIISSILLENGFLREGMMSNDGSICAVCSKLKKGHGTDHVFKPSIIIEYTGESNKNERFITLAKWNSIDNKTGANYMVLLSTITQSLTLLSTISCFVMFKPKSISTINQIFGRIRRNKSHAQLDPSLRNVNYYIFVNDTGGEIEKYAKKIAMFIDIQHTKQVMYRSAFNLYLDYTQIEPSENIFDINIKDVFTHIEKRKSKFDRNIDTVTFRAFYNYDEITHCFQLLKQLFQQRNFLHETRVYDEFKHEFSATQYNYEIALYLLCFNNKTNLFLYNENVINTLLDTDIHKRDGIIYKLCYYAPYYITLPYVDGHIVTDHIFFYERRTYSNLAKDVGRSRNVKIDISKYLAEKVNISYYDIKKDIFSRYENFDIDIINEIVVNYDESILLNLIKDCVTYIFRILINPRMILSEFHEKYINLLFYFDSLNIIIYANAVSNTSLFDDYKDFIKTNDVASIEAVDIENNEVLTISKIQTLIKSTYSKSSYTLNKYFNKFAAYLNTKSTTFTKSSPDSNEDSIDKSYANLLPIGYYFNKHVYLFKYVNRAFTWTTHDIDSLRIKDTYQYEENNIIIGFYEYSKYKIEFQARNPVQNQQVFKDKRKNEKGFTLLNKSKRYINTLCKKLNVEPMKHKRESCAAIERKLLENEYRERMNNTSIKWVYHYFE